MFLRFYHERYRIFTIACCTSLNSITSALLKIRSNNFVNSYDNHKSYFAFKTWLLGFILLFPFTNAECITVKTANLITGNGPYLSFDGINRAFTTEPLLWLRLSNGTVYQPYQDRSSSNNPIALPESVTKVKDIQTIIQFNNYPSISLSSVIASNNYFNDIDGDIGISSSGTLNVKWSDVNNNDITNWVKNNQDASLSTTDSPYKVTISSTSGRLSTRYGLPQSSDISNFQGASHTYYILPAARGRALRTQGLNYGNSFEVTSDINKNFPRTGGDGLSYYLYLSNISSEEVIAVNGTNVNAVQGEGVYLTLLPGNGILKITLNGPKYTRSGSRYGSVDKKFSRSTFVLYADRNHSKVLYQFQITKWFIRAGQATNEYLKPITKCRNFSPRLNSYGIPDENSLSTYRLNGGWGQNSISLNALFGEWGDFAGSWNLTVPTITSSGFVVDKGVIKQSQYDMRVTVLCVTDGR